MKSINIKKETSEKGNNVKEVKNVYFILIVWS